MGIAHFGVGLAVKPQAKKVPLWVLLVASELLDILSGIFFATGWERMSESDISLQNGYRFIVTGSLPYSHGLFMSLVWSLLAAGIGYLVFKDWRSGGLIGAVVFSHWVLDFIVHMPDLPVLFEGSPVLGLGLWGSGPGFIISLVIEALMVSGGLAIYLRARKREKLS